MTRSRARRTAPGVASERDADLTRMQRVVLGVLAAAAALIGAWAQVAPGSFYADFPGLRRFWVSLDGPFNEHLIRDVQPGTATETGPCIAQLTHSLISYRRHPWKKAETCQRKRSDAS